MKLLTWRASARCLLYVAALLVAMSVLLNMPGRSWRGPLPPLTDAQAALAETLRRDVTRLAAGLGPRSMWQPEHLSAAAEMIAAAFATAGLAVVHCHYAIGTTQCVNIEATLPGVSRPDEIILIGAHYDTVDDTPGADDNASGVAGLLALARAAAAHRPARTLRFVAFVNEEPPFFQTDQMGSLVYAGMCRARGDNIRAMVCLESLGYYRDEDGTQWYPPVLAPVLRPFFPSQGNFIGFTSNLRSIRLLRRVTGAFRRAAQFPSEGAVLPAFISGLSDNWAFWQHGYPAVMVTDTAMFRNPHYHTARDLPDTLDFERMARVVSGLEQVMLELAGSAATP